MPDAGTSETVDDTDTQFLSRTGGVFHLFDGSMSDPFRLAVAPDVRRKDGFVASIDIVEYRLANQVVRNGEDLQVVLFQQFSLPSTISIVGKCFIDFKMIAPAGEFDAVIPKVLGFFAEIFELQVGPLAGKQGNRTTHRSCLSKDVTAYKYFKWGGVLAHTRVPVPPYTQLQVQLTTDVLFKTSNQNLFLISLDTHSNLRSM